MQFESDNRALVLELNQLVRPVGSPLLDPGSQLSFVDLGKESIDTTFVLIDRYTFHTIDRYNDGCVDRW